jgi:hypothetical protein
MEQRILFPGLPVVRSKTKHNYLHKKRDNPDSYRDYPFFIYTYWKLPDPLHHRKEKISFDFSILIAV